MEYPLTTGQMIDQLKVMEEIAEGVDTLGKEYCVIKTEHGMNFCSSEGDTKGYTQFILNHNILGAKWRIRPRYIKFGTAMNALREGKCKSVTLHHKGKKISFSSVEPIQESLELHHEDDAWLLTWQDLFEGQWTIEW
jgi:hypothetical protein